MRPPSKDNEPDNSGVSMATRGTSGAGASDGTAPIAAVSSWAKGTAPSICATVVSAPGRVTVSSGGNSQNHVRITRKLSTVAKMRFLFWSSI